MYKNVHIKGVGSYHPKKKVKNEELLEHFKKFNLEDHAKGLMNKLGRDIRTHASSDESTVTMSVEASKNALQNAGLKAEDIDMIISVSDAAEYLSPCCAIMVRNKIGAKNSTAVFDVNSNCTGMLTAIDIACRYLKTDSKYKKILIAGGSFINSLAREDDIVSYGCFGDGGAAIILEVREESEERGFLGSRMYTDDEYYSTITFPACGMSNLNDEGRTKEDRQLLWKPFDFSFLSEKWSENIKAILDEHGYNVGDVTHYFMSQFSKADLELTFEKLEADMTKTTFVGDKYGYTGCTSPIMSLDDALKVKTFESGNLGIFCSVAAGYTIGVLLYKW